jgi:general secretion pathway protein J
MTAHLRPSTAESGFTLVEMLVALTVFALLAAAGVGILRSSVDTQSAVEGRLADVSAVGRLHTLLSSDLGQAVERPTRGPGGDRPAFAGEAAAMRFVRAGWSNLEGATRSDLQRVEWRLDRSGLVRIGHRRLDGDDGGQPALFARGVAGLALRYRHPNGEWSSAFQSSPDSALPAAVEVTLTRQGQEPLTFVVALPPRGKEATPEPPQAGGSA